MVIGAYTARTEDYDSKNMAYILTFVVLEKYRKLKIGSEMMRNLEKELKEAGDVKGIYLHVHVKNETAIGFYKKMGFTEKEKLMQYYRSIDEPHALVLVKLLD